MDAKGQICVDGCVPYGTGVNCSPQKRKNRLAGRFLRWFVGLPSFEPRERLTRTDEPVKCSISVAVQYGPLQDLPHLFASQSFPLAVTIGVNTWPEGLEIMLLLPSLPWRSGSAEMTMVSICLELLAYLMHSNELQLLNGLKRRCGHDGPGLG